MIAFFISLEMIRQSFKNELKLAKIQTFYYKKINNNSIVQSNIWKQKIIRKIISKNNCFSTILKNSKYCEANSKNEQYFKTNNKSKRNYNFL